METTNRLSAPGLSEQLLNVRSFSFYQLNSLLKRFAELHNRMTDDNVAIRYRSMPSLAFPPADVDRCDWREEGSRQFLEVTCAFMGLYGPASPLPVYYTERVIQSRDATNPSRDLMDLFNHRLISLLQRCWEKYRYFIQYDPNGVDQYTGWLLSLAGLDAQVLPERSRLRWYKLLPYVGLTSQNVCSADLLNKMVQNYFDIPTAEVEPWIRREIIIPDSQLNAMGMRNCGLGTDLILGSEMFDCSGKFMLHLKNLSLEQYHGFFPGEEPFYELIELVRYVLKDPLEFDLCLHLEHGHRDLDHLRESHQQRIGWDFVLGDLERSRLCEPVRINVSDYCTYY